MHTMTGRCHCGNISLGIVLSKDSSAYEPRACDCDFCAKHGSSYISDAQGSVRLKIHDGLNCLAYRQGSEQATFLICKGCGVLVAVFYRTTQKLYGAVNSNVLTGAPNFGPKKSVSPKQLS